MKTPVFYLIPLLLLFTSCSLLGSNEEPERPNIPGKLVFAADDSDGQSQVYTMNADGSDLKKLTSSKNGHSTQYPSWHPNGQQIIFSSFKQATTLGPTLWVMDADGSNKRVLYDPEPDNIHVVPLWGTNPRWSPDGTKVAYDACSSCSVGTKYDIYVFDTFDKSLVKVTDHFGIDSTPIWSPDGGSLIFGSTRDYEQYSFNLYKINVETKELNKLTEGGRLGFYQWLSPDEVILTENNNNFTKTTTLSLMNLNTKESNVLIPDWNVNQYSLLTSTSRKELLAITKKRNELPATFTLYDSTGEIIEEHDFNTGNLRTAIQFDWFSVSK